MTYAEDAAALVALAGIVCWLTVGVSMVGFVVFLCIAAVLAALAFSGS